MANEPSPLIPFLIVMALGLVIYGGSLLNSASLVSEAEQTTFSFLLLIPLLVLLMVHFISNSVTVPLTLLLLVYLVSRMLLGPLVLILVIYFASVYLPSFQQFSPGGAHRERDGNEQRWGTLLIFVSFLILYNLFHEGDGYEWGLSLLAVLFYALYNLFF